MPPPRHLPTRIDDRGTGATSISRRKPNSRSQTIEMPAKIAVNSVEVATMPGNRNVLKSTPPVAERVSAGQAAAQHEQQQQRLGQPGDQPALRPDEPDHLPLPDDLDRAQRVRRAGRGQLDGTGGGPAARRSPTA